MSNRPLTPDERAEMERKIKANECLPHMDGGAFGSYSAALSGKALPPPAYAAPRKLGRMDRMTTVRRATAVAIVSAAVTGGACFLLATRLLAAPVPTREGPCAALEREIPSLEWHITSAQGLGELTHTVSPMAMILMHQSYACTGEDAGALAQHLGEATSTAAAIDALRAFRGHFTPK